MSDCIFFYFSNGEIPSATLLEDEKFRVILDLGPASKGHALIIPKAHYADLTEIPEELAGESMKLAKRVVGAMKNALPCDGYNVVQNNGAPAGQTVFHYHVHLIPRYEGDGPMVAWTPGALTDADRDEILAKANAALS